MIHWIDNGAESAPALSPVADDPRGDQVGTGRSRKNRPQCTIFNKLDTHRDALEGIMKYFIG